VCGSTTKVLPLIAAAIFRILAPSNTYFAWCIPDAYAQRPPIRTSPATYSAAGAAAACAAPASGEDPLRPAPDDVVRQPAVGVTGSGALAQ
jgi:hypothetical protein